MTLQGVHFDEKELADFCRRHKVAKMSLFGSILTDRFGPSSDVDVLIELQPGARRSLFAIGGMQMELTGLLGRRVDLRTLGALSPLFRGEVADNARPLYAA